MGGGRTKDGTPIYRRIKGIYTRIAPYKNNNNVIMGVVNSGKVDIKLTKIDKNSEILKAKNFSELEKALSKHIAVSIAPELEKYGNFELVQRSMQAVDRMTKLFPILKNDFLVMQFHRKKGCDICGMDYDGFLYFFEPFFSKKNPEPLRKEGSFHPKNFSYEQVVAHELGHRIEALYLQKLYPKATERQLKASFNLHEGYINISKIMYQKLLDAGYKGHARDMMKAVSGYASKNWAEFGAESIGDVYSNGSKASPVSILFVQTLIEELNKP